MDAKQMRAKIEAMTPTELVGYVLDLKESVDKCEGCDRTATQVDCEDVPLCEECWESLIQEPTDAN